MREFDARNGWSGGFRSCAHWLSWRTGIALGAARERVRVARALERVLNADIIVFATPVWWDCHSSLIQRVIERLDEIHDLILAGKPSPLDGKVGGIVITGDSDGAQHIIGQLCNFFNAVGILVPPYGSLSVLWERQAKSESPAREELLAKYASDYTSSADRMIDGFLDYAGREARTS